MQLNLQQAVIEHHHTQLHIEQLTIQSKEYWAVVGGNGSGKTLFARTLAQQLPITSGQFSSNFCNVAILSFEQQQKMLEAIFRDRNNDCISPDDFGITAGELILSQGQQAQNYVQQLGISGLLTRPFMQLSTGESRKVLLCHILASRPDLLILDEPFEGLDQASVEQWQQLLAILSQNITIVLILSRLSDIPPQATHIALLEQLQLIMQGSRAEIAQNSLFQQLVSVENSLNVPLPTAVNAIPPLNPNLARFELKNVTIQYGDKKILDNLSLTIKPHQHWWIKGQNGAGKSTLLSVLTGDHPQSYANHVVLFGKQRGSGETIWQIKQHIGYVSSQLHMDYRVNCSVREVIISGFFDSIGVYQQIPAVLRLKADEWLARLHLSALANKPFRSLSWGQQRLLLIARAMVKHPPVLILDEPLQALDGLNRKLVKHFIEQLVENSQTQLIFVSHQNQDAPNCITHLLEFIPTAKGYIYQQTLFNKNS